jgi:hypothetical protein
LVAPIFKHQPEFRQDALASGLLHDIKNLFLSLFRRYLKDAPSKMPIATPIATPIAKFPMATPIPHPTPIPIAIPAPIGFLQPLRSLNNFITLLLKWTHSFRQLFLQSKWFSTGFKPLVATV